MVVALDAVTTALAVRFLSGTGTVTVLGGAFRLVLYRNFAGPRDTFAGHPILVSVLAIAGTAAGWWRSVGRPLIRGTRSG